MGWKIDIELIFREGPASKPTQVLDRWKETLFPSAAAELMRNSYWLFQTILQTQGSVWASLVCCWRFEKVTDLSKSILGVYVTYHRRHLYLIAGCFLTEVFGEPHFNLSDRIYCWHLKYPDDRFSMLFWWIWLSIMLGLSSANIYDL